MSLKLRKPGSKPNHPGQYSKGVKRYKSMNHQHQYKEEKHISGKVYLRCTQPRCNDHSIKQ